MATPQMVEISLDDRAAAAAAAENGEISTAADAGGVGGMPLGNKKRSKRLVVINQSMVDFRDFRTEVRAARDVEKFLEDTGMWIPPKEDDDVEGGGERGMPRVASTGNLAGSGGPTSTGTFMLDADHASTPQTIVSEWMRAAGLDDEAKLGMNPRDLVDALLTHEEVPEFRNVLAHFETLPDGSRECQGFRVIKADLGELPVRHVGMVRLKHRSQVDSIAGEDATVKYLAIVCAPAREKSSKSALEVGRTFGTMLANAQFRSDFEAARDAAAAVDAMDAFLHRNYRSDPEHSVSRRSLDNRNSLDYARMEAVERSFGEGEAERKARLQRASDIERDGCGGPLGMFGRHLYADLARRVPVYASDWTDAFRDNRSLMKTVSATVFLYFACMLPAIALGVLNEANTKGLITPVKMFCAQALGGAVFAAFGGQPLIVLLSTAPIALMTKVVYEIAHLSGYDFFALYSAVGILCSVFQAIYALTGVSRLMKYSTRSTEEIFALFITIAFLKDAITSTVKEFQAYYPEPNAARAILYLFLLLGTAWVGITLFRFRNDVLLTALLREVVADYALPISVLVMSIVGSVGFSDVDQASLSEPGEIFTSPDFGSLPAGAWGIAIVLGFSLSLLFIMDQNISAAMVNSPENKLKKGEAYHWDLLVVAIINTILAVLGLPYVHAALPHSPQHVRALADVERIYTGGTVKEVISNVREIRWSGLLSSVLLGFSVYMLPQPLENIPVPVLYGVFIFFALSPLVANAFQMWERILLLFTEQTAYPHTHYVRRVPQRQLHLFTGFQLCCLLVMCAVGFFPNPYVELLMPIVVVLLVPARQFLHRTGLLTAKQIEALDGH